MPASFSQELPLTVQPPVRYRNNPFDWNNASAETKRQADFCARWIRIQKNHIHQDHYKVFMQYLSMRKVGTYGKAYDHVKNHIYINEVIAYALYKKEQLRQELQAYNNTCAQYEITPFAFLQKGLRLKIVNWAKFIAFTTQLYNMIGYNLTAI